MKEPGAISRTPWHQDLNYWPVEGEQVCSIWIAFDHVDRSNGAMEFVAGSHRSGRRYQPFDFRHPDAVATDEFEPLPDVDAHRSKFRILTWDLEPGDAVSSPPSPCTAQPGTTRRIDGGARSPSGTPATTRASSSGRR